jgi:hypothetical protein
MFAARLDTNDRSRRRVRGRTELRASTAATMVRPRSASGPPALASSYHSWWVQKIPHPTG